VDPLVWGRLNLVGAVIFTKPIVEGFIVHIKVVIAKRGDL
jgi:hypothetical protein